ncbi:MAG: hypothetical protein HFF62_03760 [Oscillospiraceae bacterium]|nr:hypothetical protein [Oscillospiraceae bacterium]
MRNFFYQLSSATARFMYGRNGGDQLNVALLVVYLAMCLLQAAFTQNHSVSMALHLLTLAVAAVVLFRMFSRNLEKRRGFRHTPKHILARPYRRCRDRK